jgi:hypothetical protein
LVHRVVIVVFVSEQERQSVTFGCKNNAYALVKGSARPDLAGFERSGVVFRSMKHESAHRLATFRQRPDALGHALVPS